MEASKLFSLITRYIEDQNLKYSSRYSSLELRFNYFMFVFYRYDASIKKDRLFAFWFDLEELEAFLLEEYPDANDEGNS